MDQQQLLLLARLRSSNITLSAQVREQVAAWVVGQWNALESWHDDDIVRFQNIILPVIASAERKVATLTNGYLATAANVASGTNTPTKLLRLDEVSGAAVRNGVEPPVVFQRPQMVLNYQLSKGKTLTEAVKAGGDRLRNITTSNLQRARMLTVARQGERKWFRRVLTGGENCALCVVASTQRYRRGSLMPIHGGCDCGVQEEYGPDPGQILEPTTLEDIHSAIRAEFGATDRAARYIEGTTEGGDFSDLIVTREHGELGPTLTWRDQRFRGADQAAVLAN